MEGGGAAISPPDPPHYVRGEQPTPSLFAGGAGQYALFRPAPPAALVPLLLRFARCARAPRVVDLGCGTGLSTRIWAAQAAEVVGIDRSEAMLAEARRVSEHNVRYLQGDAAATGLALASVDVAVAVQSFHWMEPAATLREIGRILRAGGVFAAVDTVFPPAIDPELDLVFADFLARAQRVLGHEGGVRWSKEGHLCRMVESGQFSHVRELELHAVERGGAERFVGFAKSAVDLSSLRALGADDRDLGLDALAAAAARVLATEEDWVFGYRVRMGVK